jgi:SAM-dependent methyltransferase
MGNAAYLHGFAAEEQARLAAQAAYLAPWVYAGLRLPAAGRLLEIGAGVGAQTIQLLERSRAQVVSVEREPRQLEAWSRAVREAGRASAVAGDGRAIPLRSASMQGVFICWVLEHVSRAQEVLAEAHRVAAPDAPIVVAEVQNQSLTVWPRSPGIQRYWDVVNLTQQAMGGDPFIGARLGAMLSQAGFVDVEVEWIPIHADARDVPRRTGVFDYFHRLLRSSLGSIRASGNDWPGIDEELDREFAALRDNPESAFLYTFARATARRSP